MHTISQPQRDVRFQEVLIPEQSTHAHVQHGQHTSHSASLEACALQQPTANHFSGVQQQHLIYPAMPTYHSDRTTNAGRRHKWQVRPKYAGRQAQTLTPVQNTNGYQVQQAAPFKTTLTTSSILMPISDTTPTTSLSTHTFILPPPGFPPRPPQQQQPPLLQAGSKQPVTYCIVDGRTATSCQTQPSGPCVFPLHTQQPLCSYSNASFSPIVVANDTQQHRHCYQQTRQYSPQKFHQITPPPGFGHKVLIVPRVGEVNGMDERMHDLTKADVNTHYYDGLRHFLPITRHSVTCSKSIPQQKSSISSKLNNDLIIQVPSTYTQSPGSSPSFMVSSGGNTLKSNKSPPCREKLSPMRPVSLSVVPTNPLSQVSPLNVTDVEGDIDNRIDEQEKRNGRTKNDRRQDRNSDLLSVSSTSFDYTIEPEQMVSAICGTSPDKEMEEITDRQAQPSVEINDVANLERAAISKACRSIIRPNIQKFTKCNCENADKHYISTDNVNEGSTDHSNQSPTVDKVSSKICTVNNKDVPQINVCPENHVKNSSRPLIKELCTLAEKLCSKQLSVIRDTSASEPKECGRINVACQVDLLEASILGISFKESLLRHCRELSEILQTLPPSPHLDCIADFCSVMINTDNDLYIRSNGNSRNNCSEDGLRKLILEFLHIALSWIHINFPVGGQYIIEVLSSELCERFHVWKSRSNNLLRCMLKGHLYLINLCLSEDLNNWSSANKQDSCHLRVNPDQSTGSESGGSFCNCRGTCTSSATIVSTSGQNCSLPCTSDNHVDSTVDQDKLKSYMHNVQRNLRHWRQRRFSENQNESTDLQETSKQNGICIKPLDISMKMFNSTLLTNGVDCTSYCDTIFPADEQGIPFSKNTRGSHQGNNRGRQKPIINGEKKNMPEVNTTQNSQWPTNRTDLTTDGQIRTSMESESSEQWISETGRNKPVPLNQVDKSCSTENQHLLPGFHCGVTPAPQTQPPPLMSIQSYSEMRNHVIPSNARQFQQQNFMPNGVLHNMHTDMSVDPSISPVQPKPSRSKYSYQNSRNQLANKKKHQMNAAISICTQSHSNPVSRLYLNQDDDPCSSDDSLDRVYMKPGSYVVPKKRFSSNKLRGSIPFRINSASVTRTQSPSDMPAISVVRPPSRRLMNCSSWNAESHLSPPDLLKSSDSQERGSSESTISVPDRCSVNQQETENQEHSSNEEMREDGEINGRSERNNVTQQNDTEDCQHEVNTVIKAKERGCGDGPEDEECGPAPNMGRRKCNAEKTDHWLMRILGFQVEGDKGKDNNNEVVLTRSNSSTETDESSPQESTDIDVEVSSPEVQRPVSQETVVIDENRCVNYSDTVNGLLEGSSVITEQEEKEIIPREDHKSGEVVEIPRTRKISGGGKNKKNNKLCQEASRGITAPRKRKLQERSPNNDTETSCETKTKDDIRNKGQWSIWYSSRRRRGLSQLAVTKLEEILNCIWNMNEAEFIKYPVNPKTVEDYHQIVKHPMFLQTIAYKLRTRIYETIEQFVHDFRRIFYNSRLYNPDTSVYSEMTNVLAEKFDFLLEDIFSGWNFSHITGNPNETANIPSLQYRPYTSRGHARRRHKSKASPTTSSNKDNVPRISKTQ